MGINYNTGIAVGYEFTKEELLAPFLVSKTETKWSFQPRFDSKTGLPIEPEKVAAEFGRTVYDINGMEFRDSEYEALEELARYLDLNLTFDGFIDANPLVRVSVAAERKLEFDYDYGRLEYRKSSFIINERLLNDLKELKSKLEAAGIKVNQEPKALSYCFGG